MICSPTTRNRGNRKKMYPLKKKARQIRILPDFTDLTESWQDTDKTTVP